MHAGVRSVRTTAQPLYMCAERGIVSPHALEFEKQLERGGRRVVVDIDRTIGEEVWLAEKRNRNSWQIKRSLCLVRCFVKVFWRLRPT